MPKGSALGVILQNKMYALTCTRTFIMGWVSFFVFCYFFLFSFLFPELDFWDYINITFKCTNPVFGETWNWLSPNEVGITISTITKSFDLFFLCINSPIGKWPDRGPSPIGISYLYHTIFILSSLITVYIWSLSVSLEYMFHDG